MLNKTAYSIYSRTPHENHSKDKVPGPGQYPVTFCINEKGSYFLTKYKNSCAKNFGKVQGRCQTAENKFPGPGAYDTSK